MNINALKVKLSNIFASKNLLFLLSALIRSKFFFDEKIKTYACMNIKDGFINIFVNPNKMKEITVQDQLFVLTHELSHVYQIERTLEIIEMEKYLGNDIDTCMFYMNIALDMMVNESILRMDLFDCSEKLKNSMVKLKDKELNFDFDYNEGWESIYNKLRKIPKEDLKDFEQDFFISDQQNEQYSDNFINEVKDLLNEIRKDNAKIEEDQKEIMDKIAGNYTSPKIKIKVNKSNEESFIKVLARNIKAIGKSYFISHEETFTRPHPAFLDNEEIAGYEKIEGKNSCILIIDSSGSMKETDFKIAINLFHELDKTCVIEKVYSLDTELEEINLKELREKTCYLIGKGGTEFLPKHIQQIEKERKQSSPTTYIYVSDGEVYLDPVIEYFKTKLKKYKLYVVNTKEKNFDGRVL